MSEPIKIEPYYRSQGKQLVDCLFDKGFLSESLSRDGMDIIEELLAFYLQVGANSAARCEAVTKKYKARGEDPARSAEEMRWIARAKEAEARVSELESYWDREEKAKEAWDWGREEKAKEAWDWGREVCALLKGILSHPSFPSPFISELSIASRLYDTGIKLGITPEPDCSPGKTLEVKPAALEATDTTAWIIEVLAFLENLTSEKTTFWHFDRAEKLIQVARENFIIPKGSDDLISRANAAESMVASVTGWALKVGSFLSALTSVKQTWKDEISAPFKWTLDEGSILLGRGMELGIIPEPDCRPEPIVINASDVCVCPPKESSPGGSSQHSPRSAQGGRYGPIKQ